MAIEAGNPIGGVLIHERKIENLGNHLDLPSVKGLMNFGNMTKMGPRDLWAHAHMSESAFMYGNLMNGAITNVTSDQYSFELPTAGTYGTKVVEVHASDPAKIGWGQEPFKLTVTNAQLGSFGAHITFDPTSPYVMEIVGLQRKGDLIVYDVVYKGSYTKEDYIPAHLFQAGSQLYKYGAVKSKEFGQEYDSWYTEGFSNKEYMGLLSNAMVQTHYHVTDEAVNFFEHQELFNTKWLNSQLDQVVEYVGIKSPIQGGVKNFEDWMAKGGQPGQIGFRAIAHKYDDISMQVLDRQNSNFVIWHPGMISDANSYDKDFIAPGIWHQLDYSGYKQYYNIETLSKDTILAAIRSFNQGKIAHPNRGEEKEYKIRTGQGGAALLTKIFAAEMNSVTGLVDALATKQLAGNAKDGYDINQGWYRSITIPGQAKLSFEIDPSYDNNMTNDILNPMLSTGYRLTSYSLIIEDYNTSDSNIKILRNSKKGRQVKMNVVNGNSSHPFFEHQYMNADLHLGSSTVTGYAAYFTSRIDTGLVMDPTKILKLIPRNPFNPNGSSL